MSEGPPVQVNLVTNGGDPCRRDGPINGAPTPRFPTLGEQEQAGILLWILRILALWRILGGILSLLRVLLILAGLGITLLWILGLGIALLRPTWLRVLRILGLLLGITLLWIALLRVLGGILTRLGVGLVGVLGGSCISCFGRSDGGTFLACGKADDASNEQDDAGDRDDEA